MASLLNVNNLRLQFGSLIAIDDLSFSLERGELLAIIGPNGAGKTALLNCINGIYPSNSGAIQFSGKDLSATRLHDRASLGITRAFQHMELFGHLTVLENILLGRNCQMRSGLFSNLLYLKSTRDEEASEKEHAEEIIDFFELNRFRDQSIGNLPYGIQKLVGVARAVASKPQLLLLDEPSTGLVREEKEHLARFLLRLRHEFNPGIIWIEHDMQMVSDLADRVLVVSYGKKIAEGKPEQIRSNADVIKSYLGGVGD